MIKFVSSAARIRDRGNLRILWWEQIVGIGLLCAAFGLGVLVNHSGVQTHRDLSSLINVSGRQRMLSQRIAWLTTTPALLADPANRQTARADLRRFVANEAFLASFAQKFPQIARIYQATDPKGLTQITTRFVGQVRQVLDGGLAGPKLAQMQVDVREMALGPVLTKLNVAVDAFEKTEESGISTFTRDQEVILGLLLISLVTGTWFVVRPLIKNTGQLIEDLDRERRNQTLLLKESPTATVLLGEGGAIIDCSEGFCAEYGFAPQDLQGKTLADLIDPVAPMDLSRPADQRGVLPLDPTAHWRLVTRRRDFVVRVKSREFQLAEGGARRQIVSFTNVTNEVRRLSRQESLINEDTLTGLLSRTGFTARLGATPRGQDCSLYLIDIDHFKSINDSFGHETGDALLQTVGQALRSVAGESTIMARLSGDEFVVARVFGTWDETRLFGDRMRSAISDMLKDVNGIEAQRTVSIGVAQLRADGMLSDGLHEADLALRNAKQNGRDRVGVCDPAFIDEQRRAGAFITEGEVMAALENGELRHWVQPILNATTRRIEGFEALIRWERGTGDIRLPGQFLPVLQEVMRNPKYRALKVRMRRRLVQALAAYPDCYVSFNMYLSDLCYAGAGQSVLKDFAGLRDHPDRKILIEISEKAITERTDMGTIARQLQILRTAGIQIALDDFGVEASNIGRLTNLPLDVVKFDKSAISTVADSLRARNTVRALKLLAKINDVKVIAEGVETVEMERILCDMGIISHQGFLRARPIPPERLATLWPQDRQPQAVQEARLVHGGK